MKQASTKKTTNIQNIIGDKHVALQCKSSDNISNKLEPQEH